jgi:hypothetical protein
MTPATTPAERGKKVKNMNCYTITIKTYGDQTEERLVWAPTAAAAKRRLILARFRNRGLATRIVKVSRG